MVRHKSHPTWNQLFYGALFVLLVPKSIAAPYAGDTPKSDGSQWYRHALGMDKHCLLDNPLGQADALKPGTAAVLYKEAPQGSAQSDQLFIYVEGGGSCNSAASCTTRDDYPKNKFGYTNEVFQSETKLRDYLYLRTNPLAGDGPRISPFASMNMAMIPYCTGDVHTGRVIRKQKINSHDAAKTNFYFCGHYNFVAAVDFLLSQQFNNPNLKTIWLMGTSAGAGGVAAQYAKLRDKFTVGRPDRQVHLIEDSTPSVPIEPTHWDNMATWQTKIPGLPCTTPPTTRPQADPGFDGLSGMLWPYRTRSFKVLRAAAAPNAMYSTLSAVEDQPTGLAYPFPPDEPVASQVARFRSKTSSLDYVDVALAKPRPDTCYYVNEARVYNRSLDPNFKFGMLSFQWDSVLSPKTTQAAYEYYYPIMRANDLAVENYFSSSPHSANTRHLYFDNTGQFQSEAGVDPQGLLCGRHVPSNFKTVQLDPITVDSEIQDAHFDFIERMVPGVNWVTIDGLRPNRCPKSVGDSTYFAF